MKFNRRLGREEESGIGTLDNDDIVDVIKQLIAIRNGYDVVMISTTSVIGASARSEKWPKTPSAWV